MTSVELPLEEIFADPAFNCRGRVNPMTCGDLAQDMKLNGQIHPIMVRPYDNPTKPQLKYQIVEGFRRFYAAKINRSPTISANIRTDLTEEQARIINLTENLQRQDLSFMQEAKALARFGIGRVDDADIARVLSVRTDWVKIRRLALALPGPIHTEIENGMVNQTQILELSKMDSDEERYAAVREIKEGKIRGKKANIQSSKTRKEQPHVKKLRGKERIFEMQDYIRETFRDHELNEITAIIRTLGWAGGALSDTELYGELRRIAEENGVDYKVPDEVYALFESKA
jgi:ParB family chromosome partitioning protein